MDYREALINDFWKYFDNEELDKALTLLHRDFRALWITSNETFNSRTKFIDMNDEYPGKWHTKLKRIELTNIGAVSVVHVYSKEDDTTMEFYVTSFYEFCDNLIYTMTEYWATLEEPPEWRRKYSS